MKNVLIVILVILIVFIIVSGIVIYNLFIKEHTEPPTVSYDPGNEFVTNLKGNNGYVKADIIIEMKDNKQIKYMQNNNFKIRDSIISVLRTKTKEDMNKESIVSELKKDLISKLKEDLGLEVVNIYFEELVVQ